MPEARILIGDVRERLADIADGSVRTCITSPPYFGLRNYQVDGQLGLEETPDEYVANLVAVFAEIRRVLADDGTVWLNLGDSYNGSGGDHAVHHKNDAGFQAKGGSKNHKGRGNRVDGLKPKDLIGIPWRVAFALQQDGWYLRSDIIWHKPNPMPESVTDRPTKSHEYLFLLSKSPKYFYDYEAVKERGVMVAGDSAGSKQRDTRETHGLGGGNSGISVAKAKLAQELADKGYSTRNRRDVWTINTKPFKGAHFAVMPEALAEPCILAGSSEKGKCSECGKPWVRMVKSTRLRRNELDPSDHRYRPNTYNGAYENINGKGDSGYTTTETLGWEATCECDAGIVPDLVLDPFTGSGTVAVVALRHGRNFVGTELNPEYGEIARNRISDADPLFNQVELG